MAVALLGFTKKITGSCIIIGLANICVFLQFFPYYWARLDTTRFYLSTSPKKGTGTFPARPPRIIYEIRANETHHVHDVYECKVGKQTTMGPRRFPAEARRIDRVPLPTKLLSHLSIGRVYLQTDLDIIFVGDSLAWQFHNLWTEAVGGTVEEIGHGMSVTKYEDENERRSDNGGVYHGMMLNGSSGVAAHLRITDFLSNQTEESVAGRLKANKSWSREGVRNNVLNRTTVKESQQLQGFDAMIYRIPHGWIHAREITMERILESLKTASETLGISSIILVTPHLINNVNSVEEWYGLQRFRGLLRNVTQQWEPSPEFGNLRHVVLFDFGRYTDLLIEQNAKVLDMDTDRDMYVLDRLSSKCYAWPPSIALACGEPRVDPGQCQCKRNMWSADGTHFCMSQVGAPMMAGWACILACLFPPLPTTQTHASMCADLCNQQYLIFNPLMVAGLPPRNNSRGA